CLQYKNYPWTF
nr:immunoglobulin light chain junction region [Macaca mulatta]